jgi:uncharacterized protein DUF6662
VIQQSNSKKSVKGEKMIYRWFIVRIAFAAFLAVPALGFLDQARADENLWGYLYGAETLPKGGTEIYNWLTLRTGKGKGTYRGWDEMLELEHGFTDRFQASFYLKGRSHRIAGGALEEDEDRNLSRSLDFNGVNVAFKYNLLSPYKDLFGLSLYLEPSYSRIDRVSGERMDQFGLEQKLILQKNFFDDQLALGYNFTLEPEWSKFKSSGERERELEVEHTFGISYRFAPRWFAGLEGRYHAEYPEFKGPQEGAFFLGPNIHYAAEKWWFTFTFLPQVAGRPPTPRRTRNLELEEHERYEFRLKVAWVF